MNVHGPHRFYRLPCIRKLLSFSVQLVNSFEVARKTLFIITMNYFFPSHLQDEVVKTIKILDLMNYESPESEWSLLVESATWPLHDPCEVKITLLLEFLACSC